ncbi:MAG: ATP-binding cassette domain-containing protein [Erysipelotrichaceae bacterium]|nr:ATP-binding cassette domain-containing protein [Erysipelotrichaceae bacterium]
MTSAEILWRVVEDLHANNQFEEVLSNTLTVFEDAFKVKSASCWVTDKKSHRIYVIANTGEVDFTGYSVDYGEGIVGKATVEGRTLTDEDPDVMISDDEKHFIEGHCMAVPLHSPYGNYGAILLSNRASRFTSEEIKICENIASLIALDLEEKDTFSFDDNRKVILSLRGVIKEFMSGEEIRRILKGIDLDIYEKELLVVLGESGCGKSTMLNIIGGMDELTQGQMLVEGKDFSHPSEKELTDYRRDYIGYIFQSYNLMPNLNALENIEFIAEIAKNPLDSEEALEQVGLADRWNRYPSSMSGGQQQRVCIARAIVKDPMIILADEPTAALDFVTGQGVLKVIEKIVRERGKTVIMVTHNVEIAKMADRVIKLKNGKISSVRINHHPLHAEDLSW